jgi:hypothetical protein
MTVSIISSGAIVLVAIIESLATLERRSAKRSQEQMKAREEARADESKLAMQMMDASLALGIATAIAVEEGKLNGEMKSAKQRAKEARENYQGFLQNIAAHQVVKI